MKHFLNNSFFAVDFRGQFLLNWFLISCSQYGCSANGMLQILGLVF